MDDLEKKKFELDPDVIAADVSFDSGIAKDDNDNSEPSKETLENSETKNDESETGESEIDEADCIAERSTVLQDSVPLEEYKSILDEHFQNLRGLIKYTKAKDDTIRKLSNELQKYREDYCAKSFKSIATLLISYREDCRRSLSDLGSFELTFDKAKKFISFLGDDLEELLSNAGCEYENEKWYFNGKPLTIDMADGVKFPSLFDGSNLEEDVCEQFEGRTIKEYLVSVENRIKQILSNNEMLDKCLNEYCTLSTLIESDIVYVCVYPPIRKLIALYDKTKQKIDVCISDMNEDNMLEMYSEMLTSLIDEMEEILLCGGVKIDTTTDEVFDTKKNRLIKAITTNDESLDRKIAKQYTECYTMNDVVIYPAKVDVYKYQAI